MRSNNFTINFITISVMSSESCDPIATDGVPYTLHISFVICVNLNTKFPPSLYIYKMYVYIYTHTMLCMHIYYLCAFI